MDDDVKNVVSETDRLIPETDCTPEDSSIQRRPHIPKRTDPHYNRLKYYSRLSHTMEGDEKVGIVDIPKEIIEEPTLFELPTGINRNSSLAIILSITNTMLGSTIFTLPWSLGESGLVLGLIIFVVTAVISYYTCTLIIRHTAFRGFSDFGEVCRVELGRWAQWLASFVSVVILVSASIAYHIFMKDSLLRVCNAIFSIDSDGPFWNQYTASLWIILSMFPIANLKTMTFLMKINSFGVIFLIIILMFIIYSCIREYINPSWIDADKVSVWYPRVDEEKVNHLKLFSKNFSHLFGVLSLSFFIHNVISSILRVPEKSKRLRTYRDVGIAYFLSGLCYLVPSVMGITAFRFEKSLEQNFLNQFGSANIGATIARIAILFQLATIYPLLIYIIRIQVFQLFLKKPYPGFVLVFLLSAVCCTISTLFAMFYPKVGTILQYSGAFCGMIYSYFLPVCLHLKISWQEKKLKWYSVIIHGILVLFGVSIFILQLIPSS